MASGRVPSVNAASRVSSGQRRSVGFRSNVIRFRPPRTLPTVHGHEPRFFSRRYNVAGARVLGHPRPEALENTAQPAVGLLRIPQPGNLGDLRERQPLVESESQDHAVFGLEALDR